jgi:hypothetical protein
MQARIIADKATHRHVVCEGHRAVVGLVEGRVKPARHNTHVWEGGAHADDLDLLGQGLNGVQAQYLPW